jgi:hypothetical protein
LLSRLKALNDQLNEQNQGHVRRLKALNDKFNEQNQAPFRRLKALKPIKTNSQYTELILKFKSLLESVRGISEHPLDTSISCQSLVVVIFYFHTRHSMISLMNRIKLLSEDSRHSMISYPQGKYIIV